MSLLGFVMGAFLMLAGFAMVRYTDKFIQFFGDLGEVLGFLNTQWLSWKILGIFLLLVGFLVAFGLIELFIGATVGRFFLFGDSPL